MAATRFRPCLEQEWDSPAIVSHQRQSLARSLRKAGVIILAEKIPLLPIRHGMYHYTRIASAQPVRYFWRNVFVQQEPKHVSAWMVCQ
jgi:hypothetical protein